MALYENEFVLNENETTLYEIELDLNENEDRK